MLIKNAKKLFAMILVLVIISCNIVGCFDQQGQTATSKDRVSILINSYQNGKVVADCGESVEKGSEITLAVTPNYGYKLSSLLLNGEEKVTEVYSGRYKFVANEDTEISAEFSYDLCLVKGRVIPDDRNYEYLKVEFIKGLKTYEADVDSEGNYSILLEPGVYSMHITHDVFEEVYLDDINVVSDTAIQDVAMNKRGMGDSAVGDVKCNGLFIENDDGYSSGGERVDTIYFQGFSSNKYILQADLEYMGGYYTPRPGLIVGQDEDWIVALSFNLVVPDTDWVSLVRINTNNFNDWQYGKDYNLGDTGIREGKLTITVVRDVRDICVYFDGELIFEEKNSSWFTDEATAAGLFSDCAHTKYTNIEITEDMTKLDEMLEGASKDDEPAGEKKEVDVIILAGQSNAAGTTVTSMLKQNYLNLYEKYKNGFDSAYISYIADNNMGTRFVPVKFGQGCNVDHFGPEIGIAAYYSEHYPDKELYIIKCAYGGTNLANQWASSSAGVSDGPLYINLIKHIDDCLDKMQSKNLIPNIVSFCWMQGEADGVEIPMTKIYYSRLDALVSDIRARYSEYSKYDEISFVDATVSEIDYWPYANQINAQKKEFASKSNYNFIVDTQKLGLRTDKENNDLAHYDSASMIQLGLAFGEKSFVIEESDNKNLVQNSYPKADDAILVTHGEGAHSVNAYISTYFESDMMIISFDAEDVNGLNFGDDITFDILINGKTFSVCLSTTQYTVNGAEVKAGEKFFFSFLKTDKGYNGILGIGYSHLGVSSDNVDDIAVNTTISNVVISKDNSLGNSAIGSVSQRGDWNFIDGVLTNQGRSWTFFKGYSGTKYAVEAKLTLVQNGSIARPGVVVAQDDNWVIAFALQLNNANVDWVGLVRVSVSDPSNIEYLHTSFVNAPSYGVRTEDGAKMTAVRDGDDLYLFINGKLIIKLIDCEWMRGVGETAGGLFNEDCVCSYENYSYISDESIVNDLIGKTSSTVSSLPEFGNWVKNDDGSYTNPDATVFQGGFLGLATLDTDKYVATATVSVSSALKNGARPGVIVAGNSEYVLAVAFCEGYIGLVRRSALNVSDWYIPAGYVVNEALMGQGSPSCVLTVLRDGNCFHVFVNDNYVGKYIFDVIGDGMFGFFNVYADATFSNYEVDTSTETIDFWTSKIHK
ncbi:MAG: hypothetical protein IJP20_04590 [Clostridia bacterium]|nr:hypothetical protein [Clostridia bacterium]